MGSYLEDQLWETWEDDVGSFFKWLKVICELDEDNEVYRIFQSCVETTNDLREYIGNFFDGDLDNLEATAYGYRKWKQSTIKGA
ncbi:hypothetical protein [Paenibacillus xylaniclasticus]|uniref:hypothetical protein n=1 Tax=Paenibacillus xylaniclasticus TaxID=588083 RepID=UPI000FD9DFAA|nr:MULTISPECIES: hypothetical protein [Paenibacillus]GFN32505.1 hypothetical protein PCURB6_27650 [Paenibacillus curdlanolyticus]